MTTLEQRLAEALRAGGATMEPAPDLFARVQGSIKDDIHRRRLRRRAATIMGLLVAASGSLAWGLSVTMNGRLVMPWWVLEMITSIVLVGVALWLGPFIKRFGRAYAADVFRANPRTGKSYIVLTDIVYYLIFTAYILFTLRFARDTGWGPLVGARQLQAAVYRLGGILLIIGILHGLNILLMPLIGRLFSLNRRLDSDQVDDGPL